MQTWTQQMQAIVDGIVDFGDMRTATRDCAKVADAALGAWVAEELSRGKDVRPPCWAFVADRAVAVLIDYGLGKLIREEEASVPLAEMLLVQMGEVADTATEEQLAAAER